MFLASQSNSSHVCRKNVRVSFRGQDQCTCPAFVPAIINGAGKRNNLVYSMILFRLEEVGRWAVSLNGA